MKSIFTSFLICFSVFVLSAQQNTTRQDNGGGYTPPENTSIYELDGLLLKPQTLLGLNINARSIEKMSVDKIYTYRDGDILYVGKIIIKTDLIVVLDGEKLDNKTKYKMLPKLTEKNVTSIKLLNEKTSKEKYGAKNRVQVLVIDTKK